MTALDRRRRLLGACLSLVIALPALSGCAAKLPKLAVCDGKHRRDANPYGTVLPGAPAKAPIAAPALPPVDAGASEPAAAAPPKTSAITPPSSYVSC